MQYDVIGLEARDHLARVHASLDHFERDLAFDRVRLFGEPDLAHPPCADAVDETIRTDSFEVTVSRLA